MAVLLVLLSLLPLVIGWLMNTVLLSFISTGSVLAISNFLMLIMWAAMAYFFKPRLLKTWKVLLLMHIVPGVMLVLAAAQLLVLEQWIGILGTWTQLYFTPLLYFGFTLTFWTDSLFLSYCAVFVLQLLVAFSACRRRSK